MKKIHAVCCLCFSFMMFALAGFVPAVAAEEAAAGAQLDAQKYPVLSQSDVPVLKGDLWTTASQDSKVAYVWGMCSIFEVERIVTMRIPELKVRNVSAVAAEGLQNVPMNDIVRAVDEYYKANPGNLDVPVLKIIWDTMVKPKVTTGVAGRPLQ
jgi:hypothetical protein